MKKLFMLFVSVICILSACHRGPNPKESLVAAGNALQNFDADVVDKYIDISSIINGAIDVAAKQDIKGLSKEEIMGMTAAKMIIVPIAKQFILEGIKQAANSEYKDYIKMVKVKSYEILSNKDGIASAKVTFNFEDAKKYALDKNLVPEDAKPYMENTETTLILKMKQNGEYWQITEITNLDELIKKYAPLYEEKMKEAKEKRQREQEEKFRQWEQQNEERIKQQNKELNYSQKKDEFWKHTELMRLITDSQRRYYKLNGKYTDDFNNLDFNLNNIKDILSKGSSSFTTKDLVTYVIDKEKVTETKPQKYTLELYYSKGKLTCKDNFDGSCREIGASNVYFNFYPASGKIKR